MLNNTQLLLIFYLLLIPLICAGLAYILSKWIFKNSEHKKFVTRGVITGIVIDILFIVVLFYAIKKLT